MYSQYTSSSSLHRNVYSISVFQCNAMGRMVHNSLVETRPVVLTVILQSTREMFAGMFALSGKNSVKPFLLAVLHSTGGLSRLMDATAVRPFCGAAGGRAIRTAAAPACLITLSRAAQRAKHTHQFL